ncbi:hypothetical protein [Fusobacterium nucleatum]|uniref:hypothetical protein n=1 Tax=Fusobacterium nucleatum TaxID=851 RepID=UPI00201A5A47|nr:hypothetical protein [Fusobacterium nucleatum]MCL4592244.1 hypothetical protein [Fusobacterium nucleatum YWH7053]
MKILKTKIIIFIIVIIIFPYFIDIFVIGNKNIKINSSNESLFMFLASYTGSILSLIGISWQVFRNEKINKKEKYKGLLNYIEYILEENIKLFNKNSISKEKYLLYSYGIKNWYHNFKIFLKEFSDTYFEDNYSAIFNLEFYKILMSVKDKIKEHNKKVVSLVKLFNNKLNLIKNIKNSIQNLYEIEKNSYLKDYIKIFELLDLVSFSLYLKIKNGNSSYLAEKISKILENFKYEYPISNYIEKVNKIISDDIGKKENTEKEIRELVNFIILVRDNAFFKIASHKDLQNRLEAEILEFDKYINFENSLLEINLEVKELEDLILKVKEEKGKYEKIKLINIFSYRKYSNLL